MSSISRTYEHTANGHVLPSVRQVATMSSNIPLVRMSLLTLALTDKCFELQNQTTRQVIRTHNTLPC